jgi:hypothetical protein
LPGRLSARTCVDAAAKRLNVDVASYQEPSWVVMTKLGVGVVVPAIALLPGVWRASAVTVRQALDYRSTGRAIAVCLAGWVLSLAIAALVANLFPRSVS